MFVRLHDLTNLTVDVDVVRNLNVYSVMSFFSRFLSKGNSFSVLDSLNGNKIFISYEQRP